MHFADACNSVGEIPQYVQCNSGANTCPALDLSGIAKLLLQSACRRRLEKLAKTRAGIRKTPGWQFDSKRIQCFEDGLSVLVCDHVIGPFVRNRLQPV